VYVIVIPLRNAKEFNLIIDISLNKTLFHCKNEEGQIKCKPGDFKRI
jgi:hypothetical protein